MGTALDNHELPWNYNWQLTNEIKAYDFVSSKAIETTANAANAITALNAYIGALQTYLFNLPNFNEAVDISELEGFESNIEVAPFDGSIEVQPLTSVYEPISGLNTHIDTGAFDSDVSPSDMPTFVSSVDIASIMGTEPVAPIVPVINLDDLMTTLDNVGYNFFTSRFLDDVELRCNEIINTGGAGLADVEQEMFERETERNTLINADAKDKIASEWSKRGFDLPGVGLFNAMSQVDAEYQNNQLDKSRKIAEESRKFEIQMEQTALDLATKAAALREDAFEKEQDRLVNTLNELFKQSIAIVEAKLKNILGELQVYSEQMKGFATRLGAAEVAAKIDNTIMVSEVEIAKLEVGVLTTEKELDLKYLTTKIAANEAEVNGEVKIAMANSDAMSKADDAQVKWIEADARAQGIVMESKNNRDNNWVKGRMAEDELTLKKLMNIVTIRAAEMEANLKEYIAKMNLEAGMLESMTKIQAQVAASAMSAFHAAATLTGSQQTSRSMSQSDTENYNHSESF